MEEDELYDTGNNTLRISPIQKKHLIWKYLEHFPSMTVGMHE